MSAGLFGSGAAAVWWAGRAIQGGGRLGVWQLEARIASWRGHPAEPGVHFGPPPAGVPAARLTTILHRGDRGLAMRGGPARWLEDLGAVGADQAVLGDLLLAAAAHPGQPSGWRRLSGLLGLPLSPAAAARGPSLAEALPDDWARWLDLPLLAAGAGGPAEVGMEAFCLLLAADGWPWHVRAESAWADETVAGWRTAGGEVRSPEADAQVPAGAWVAPGPWWGRRLGCPARRFVQVVGEVGPGFHNQLHILQADPGLPALEENLIVGISRLPDADRPLAEGRRASVGAWFAEEWWEDGVSFPEERLGATLAAAADRLFPGFQAERFIVPAAPTRWDGAWGRPDARQHFWRRRRLLGHRVLGVAGLPSGCHLAALGSQTQA
ncbi:hypothetical protein IIA16_01780 [bacterium]|nr:hypothetical protein [bacterium]